MVYLNAQFLYMLGISLVTIILIAANVLISIKGFNDQVFFEKYKFNVGRIKLGERFRFLSSGFLHADGAHLFFNMITFYFFADIVVDQIGYVKFLLIYLVSLLTGNLLSYYFHKDEPYYSAVGASGAVTGILYAAIMLYPEMSLYLFFIPIPIPGYLFGLAYLLYSIYGMKTRAGNIGHDAHFGGAVAGYLMVILYNPMILKYNLWIVLVMLLPIVLLFILKRLGKI